MKSLQIRHRTRPSNFEFLVASFSYRVPSSSISTSDYSYIYIIYSIDLFNKTKNEIMRKVAMTPICRECSRLYLPFLEMTKYVWLRLSELFVHIKRKKRKNMLELLFNCALVAHLLTVINGIIESRGKTCICKRIRSCKYVLRCNIVTARRWFPIKLITIAR